MKQKSGFSGQIGFVLAAAGSAVGVGNLWRFPYLAAKDGGGLFLIIYLVLVLTVGLDSHCSQQILQLDEKQEKVPFMHMNQ